MAGFMAGPTQLHGRLGVRVKVKAWVKVRAGDGGGVSGGVCVGSQDRLSARTIALAVPNLLIVKVIVNRNSGHSELYSNDYLNRNSQLRVRVAQLHT